MEEGRKKNKLTVSLIAAMLVVAVILGGTYAWLRIGISGSKTNIVKAGYLDLVLDESTTNGIRLEREIPKSYRQGILNTAYTFKLLNNSTIDTDYTISIVDDYTGADANLTADDKITDDLIRYVLVKNGEGLTASNSKILENNRAIDTGTIVGKTGVTPTEISYTLYVWIDSRAGDAVNEVGTEENIMNKIFNGKLSIVAEQHHEAAAPAQVAFNPTYYAYGLPTTSSDTTEPDGHNVFVGLDSQESKGVCIKRGGTTNCFQINNVAYERTHIQQVFSDITCVSNDEYERYECSADDFKCYIRNNGSVYCVDHTNYEENCEVDHNGEVACELTP